MSIVVASAHLSEDEFLRAVGSCELPLSSFRHGDHLRLAWLRLHRTTVAQAIDEVQRDILRFAAHHGAAHIFHQTVTTAWVRLLASHNEASFDRFLTDNEQRLSSNLLQEFWSPAALQSEAARHGWLPPDRRELPGVTRP